MKTVWCVVLFSSLLLAQKSEAQYVTIPDSNFVAWLDTHGYSSCLVGNQLDTTCTQVVVWSTMSCIYANISNLEGIQYFDNLQTLICNYNQLTFLPSLPSGLKILECHDNQLTALPNLPDSLKELMCYTNQLAALPNLPNTLLELNCIGNQLTFLPPLPLALIVLRCNSNPLDAIPDLPNGLLILQCMNCTLEELPALNDGLEWLNCSYNPLTQLPELPSSLARLECSGDSLTSLPDFPPALELLDCSFNQLSSLPAFTASGYYKLILNDNPELLCLPPFQEFTGPSNNFDISNTGISCLPNLIRQTTGNNLTIDTMPICEFINQNGCEVGWNVLSTVYLDTDSDCTKDTSESGLPNVKIDLYQAGDVIQQVYTNAVGQYTFVADTLGSYSIAVDSYLLPFLVICPAGNQFTFDFATNPIADNMDFGLACMAGYDLGINSIVNGGLLFPGNPAYLLIKAGDLAQNYIATGCNTTGLTGSVTVSIVGPIGIDTISNNGLVSGNTITWNITDFSSVDFFNDFWLQLTTDTSALAGDLVCITVTVSADTGTDNDPQNDSLTHCFTVVNSYDPNVKEVYPATVSEPGDWHTYTIHFQNTGTAAAHNIVVKDTLDTLLDWSSFQLLAYSHENLTQVLQNGIVHFSFPNIQLPDSNSNEPESHGFVQYRIKTDSTITYGTEIHNTAAIYFDFNEPIITNDALVVYEEPESVSTLFTSNNTFMLYPNPASNDVTVKRSMNTNALVEVTDLTGKVLFSVASEKLETKLSLENLSVGSYLIRLVENNRVIGVKKLAVIR